MSSTDVGRPPWGLTFCEEERQGFQLEASRRARTPRWLHARDLSRLRPAAPRQDEFSPTCPWEEL